ncbi:hypothetical protein E4U56_001184 [Claviceps arundinis]|uniref:Ubiquitin-like domain-containing protein n=1 Tax=Claviceps arundinis TaxID=1623583 RepID=A0A9P7SQ82_9HYPO|nr:hypothetical protein E4U56_001184 [Claviceps arundinis]
MSELPMTPMPPRAKKLPFKPTALRKCTTKFSASVAPDASIDCEKVQNEDGLDIFRRSKEMQPIMEADRERRLLRRKLKEEEERKKAAKEAEVRRKAAEEVEQRRKAAMEREKRRKAAEKSGKRPWEDSENDGDGGLARVSPPSSQSPSKAFRSTTPIKVDADISDEDQNELATPPASKRTRLSSTPTRMKRLASSDPTSTTRGSSILSQAASAIARESPRRRLRSTKPRPDPVPVVLSDSEDDDGDSDDDDHAPASTPSKIDEGDDVAILGSSFAAGDEDDEFADYIRKAEEQRRNQALIKVSQNSGAPKECIQILITSTLPNINPFRVKFLYDRPLRLVKDTWLAMQTSRGLLRDLEDTNDIIMTWKKKKIYVSSTILNLGIRPPAKSRLDMDGLSTAGLDDNSTMHVHFEVWTKAQFDEMERAEESWQRKRDAGELSDDDDSLDHLPEEPAVPEAKLRVVLKSRGLPDVKLTVRPETTVETLITGFQTQQASAVGKDVGIWFDGDRLEEHMTMEEVEIDDLDTLEVHVK